MYENEPQSYLCTKSKVLFLSKLYWRIYAIKYSINQRWYERSYLILLDFRITTKMKSSMKLLMMFRNVIIWLLEKYLVKHLEVTIITVMFSFFNANGRSINKNFEKVKESINSTNHHPFTIIGLSETHLKEPPSKYYH